MKVFHNCKMTSVFFDEEIAEEGFPCKIEINGQRIVVKYDDDDGFVNYIGEEVANGHFTLICNERSGTASLHMFPNSNILEGHWKEGDARGMWRIFLKE